MNLAPNITGEAISLQNSMGGNSSCHRSTIGDERTGYFCHSRIETGPHEIPNVVAFVII